MRYGNITSTQLKQFRKKHGLGPHDSLTSEQFRELLSDRVGTGRLKKDNSSSFIYSIETIENGYKITLTGKHLSKNVLNGSSFKRKLAYKKAIKTSMQNYWMTNRSFIKSITPFSKASVSYTFYNARSRDSDGNSETVKIFQDTFTLLRLIVDDTRECLQCKTVDEVLQKDYKVEAILTKIIED